MPSKFSYHNWTYLWKQVYFSATHNIKINSFESFLQYFQQSLLYDWLFTAERVT